MRLEFAIFPGRTSHAPPHYLAAYATFESVWEETLTNIYGRPHIQHSNDFTRQDCIQAVFDEDTCAALDCVRTIHLRNAVDLKDSWLKPWPLEILELLAVESDVALVNSYFTVHPGYRKNATSDEHSISYLLGCLSVLYQLEAGFPLMLGMMRHDRSMHTLGVSWGASRLLTTVYNNINTDLVVFRTDAILAASSAFPAIVFDLFRRRVQLP